MRNPLKDLFSTDEPQYKLNLKMRDAESHAKLWDAINDSTEEERFIELDGIEKIDTYVETPDGKFLVDSSEGEIIEFFIGPSIENLPFDVETDYGKYTFQFERIHKEKQIVVKTKADSPVLLRITHEYNSSKVNATYKSNPQSADNVEALLKIYNATYHFLRKFFKHETGEEISTLLSTLQNLESYWKRVHEIEKALNIQFAPSEVTDSKEDEGEIEKLYLLIVKNLPIRRNNNEVAFTFNGSWDADNKELPNISVGSEMGVVSEGELHYDLYGAVFSIFTVDYFINATVASIENDLENDKYIVRCVGTETRPLYAVQCGYKSESDLPDKDTAFSKDMELIKKSKTFNELMDEMQNEYQSTIRMRE